MRAGKTRAINKEGSANSLIDWTGDLSSLHFAMGFLLTRKKFNLMSPFEVWGSVEIGDFVLYIHPESNIVTASEAGNKVVIVGLCCDPIQDLRASQVAQNLCNHAGHLDERFFSEVARLSGRFVIFASNRSETVVIPDACATKAVYYAPDSTSSLVCASHPTLFSEVLGYPPDTEAFRFLQSPEYSKEPPTTRYLPGYKTTVAGVRAVTPNLYLSAENRSLTRFYPRTARIERSDFRNIADEISHIIRRQFELYERREQITLSLTAGLDSRVSLSLIGSQERVMCFTNSFGPAQSAHVLRDALLARDIAKAMRLPYRRLDCPWPVPEAIAEEYKAYLSVANRCFGILNSDSYSQFIYTKNYPRKYLHLRSNVSEVGRVFYKQHRKESFSAMDFAYKFSPYAGPIPYVQKSFEEWLGVTGLNCVMELGYDKYDFFYWEHRLSQWLAPQLTISDIAQNCVVPINSRIILELLLSVPFQKRLDNTIFYLMLQSSNPRLMLFPVNPPYSWAEARRSEIA